MQKALADEIVACLQGERTVYSQGVFTVTSGTAFAVAGWAPRREALGMVVPFPSRVTLATARHGKPLRHPLLTVITPVTVTATASACCANAAGGSRGKFYLLWEKPSTKRNADTDARWLTMSKLTKKEERCFPLRQ